MKGIGILIGILEDDILSTNKYNIFLSVKANGCTILEKRLSHCNSNSDLKSCLMNSLDVQSKLAVTENLIVHYCQKINQLKIKY